MTRAELACDASWVNLSARIGVAFFAVIGIGLLIAGVLAWSSQRSFDARARTADGVVVDATDVRRSDGTVFYRGTVEWKDEHAAAHRYDISSDNLGEIAKGKKVEVRYDPAHPEEVHTGSDHFGILILLALGLGFSGVSIRVAIQALRTKRS